MIRATDITLILSVIGYCFISIPVGLFFLGMTLPAIFIDIARKSQC